MSTRTLRVNELLQRELSGLLRREYQVEATAITVIGVEVTPDLAEGRVFVAVTGDEARAEDRLRWLRRHAAELRFGLGRRVELRHIPVLSYVLDTATARGNQVLSVLDEIARQEKPAASEPPPATP